jgi:hypothetical protein
MTTSANAAHTAYPLAWPLGWPRTEARLRERGQFKTELSSALSNLKRQVALMRGTALVLSSNYTLGAESPADSGVVAYFSWKNLSVAIPCDRWARMQHNVHAIALTIEAMRGMERWGAKHMIEAMFTGFKALPQSVNGSPWWQILGVDKAARAEVVREAYRVLVKKHHPDAGGDGELFRRAQVAYEEFERVRGQG